MILGPAQGNRCRILHYTEAPTLLYAIFKLEVWLVISDRLIHQGKVSFSCLLSMLDIYHTLCRNKERNGYNMRIFGIVEPHSIYAEAGEIGLLLSSILKSTPSLLFPGTCIHIYSVHYSVDRSGDLSQTPLKGCRWYIPDHVLQYFMAEADNNTTWAEWLYHWKKEIPWAEQTLVIHAVSAHLPLALRQPLNGDRCIHAWCYSWMRVFCPSFFIQAY